MTELKNLYRRRFGNVAEYRKELFKILCQDFFYRYVPEDSVVVDIAAGYCDFINNIVAKRKIAVDLNPDVKKYAHEDVETILTNSTDLSMIKESSADIVFVSSLFEHLSKEDNEKTFKEIHRILKTNAKLLIIQPNIRYCYKDYWMYWDHITAVDDRGLTEALETMGFKMTEVRAKFLPYTINSNLPRSPLLFRIYLNMPLIHPIFGKQSFLCAQKI